MDQTREQSPDFCLSFVRVEGIALVPPIGVVVMEVLVDGALGVGGVGGVGWMFGEAGVGGRKLISLKTRRYSGNTCSILKVTKISGSFES